MGLKGKLFCLHRLKRQNSVSQAKSAVPSAGDGGLFSSGCSQASTNCEIPFFSPPGSALAQGSQHISVVGKPEHAETPRQSLMCGTCHTSDQAFKCTQQHFVRAMVACNSLQYAHAQSKSCDVSARLIYHSMGLLSFSRT